MPDRAWTPARIEAALGWLPRPEFRERLRSELERTAMMTTATAAISTVSVTPYLVAADAPRLIDFTKTVFGAEETVRTVGSAGGVHAEVRIGDSTVMIGGGAPDLSWRGAAMPTALHVYVPDVDLAFARAKEAGATVGQAPADMPYGERGAGVIDAAGNRWYIATARGAHHVPPGLNSVNVYLHPLRAAPVIQFMTRAFGAALLEQHASPEGVIQHAKVQIGRSTVEMGEAQGAYQPMPTMFYVQVPDADAAYRAALDAGATSLGSPADQAHGVRQAAVQDPFGNQWFVAAPSRVDKS